MTHKNQPASPDSGESKDKYEQIKEELGYDDEDIRILASSIKTGLLDVIGPERERKLAYLLRERKKRDWELIEQRIKNDCSPETKIKIKKIVATNPGMLTGFVEVAEKKGNLEALIKAKDVYGDNMEMFEGFVELAKRRYSKSDKVDALAAAKEAYGNSMEMFKDFVEVAKEPGWTYAVDALAAAKEVYGNDMEMFKRFVQLAKIEMGACAVRALAAAKKVYGNDMEKFEQVKKMIVEVAKEPGWNYMVDAMAAAKDVYGNDMEKFEQVKNLILEVKNKRKFDNALWELAAAKEVYGNDMEMFKDFVEVAKRAQSDNAITALAAASEVYGKDSEMFKTFVEVAKNEKNLGNTVRALAAAKAVYGNDPKKFEQVKDLIVEVAKGYGGYDRVTPLAAAQEAYGNNLELFKGFVEVAKQGFVNALAAAKAVYGKDPKKFEQVKNLFFEVTKVLKCKASYTTCEVDEALAAASEVYGNDLAKFERVINLIAEIVKNVGEFQMKYQFDALAKAKVVYGNDMEMFKGFVEVAKGGDSGSAVDALAKVKPVYGNDMQKFEAFVEVAKGENGGSAVDALVAASEVYGNDLDKLEQVKDLIVEVAKGENGGSAVRALAEVKAVYGNEMKKFEQVKDLIVEVVKGKNGGSAVNALVSVKEAYGNDPEMFKGFVEAAKGENGEKAVNALAAAKEVYGKDPKKFKVFVEVARVPNGDNLVKELAAAKEVYGNNLEMFKCFAEVARGPNGDNLVKALAAAKMAYGKDPSRLRAAVTFFNHREFVETNAIPGYVDAYMDKGEQAAVEYLRDFKKRAIGIIGPEPPYQARKFKDYRQLVEYVFPPGNYSSYEHNLSCGDKREHLEEYTYNREGYPVEMSGLKGYRLLEGKEENGELLDEYQNRLSRIRDFVASRGPDNEALQKEFEKKVDELYKQKADPRLQKVEKSDVKIKMLALFLTEVLKKSQQKNYKPNTAILDLIIEYKYAYNENLETYIQRTADETKKLQDTVSRNFNLWRELSTIYGENLKHVLRHDFFEDMGGGREKLEGAFDELLSAEGEKELLGKKAKTRLEAVFDNEKIPPDKKTAALMTPVNGTFLSNLKFKDEKDKKQCRDDVAQVMAQLGDRPDKEKFFEDTVPKLLAIRHKYLFDLNSKLEEFFSSDINKINEEIAKYDEVTETERKETRMGGNKHKEVKKKSKKRKIRGLFLKTQETANARMGAYLCIAGDKGMWENKNYFELVMKDEESGKCVGLVMCLKIEASDGKKYLWFGPNPFEGFLSQVSSEQCYRYLYDTVANFAEENGFDGMVVPAEEGQILGACTNRGGDFPDLIKSSRLRDSKGNLKNVAFGGKHALGGSYGYEKGALIWDRKTAIQSKRIVA